MSNLIDELDKDIEKAELNYVQKQKDNEGVYLLYINSTIDEEKIIKLCKKYCDDFIFKRRISRDQLSELKKTYGFDEFEIGHDDKRLLKTYGKDLILIIPKTINQQL